MNVPFESARRKNRTVTDDTDMCNGCEEPCGSCDSGAVCYMNWDRCTDRLCDLYSSGCPYDQSLSGICPRCGATWDKRLKKGMYPALSRRDKKTDICSICGTLEAFEDASLKPPYKGEVYWVEES